MHTAQTIAIIGATGKTGTAIAEALAGGNYRLLLFARNALRLKKMVNSFTIKYPGTCVLPFSCAYAAGWEADIIVFAVPFPAEQEIACRIKAVANQKIVVSIMDDSEKCTRELQTLLPYSKLVSLQYRPNEMQQPELFASGKDSEALDTINEIITSLTYNN